jgi:uncharacterized protein
MAGCASGPVGEQGNRLYLEGYNDVRMPVSSMLERRYERVVRQQYDFSCGAAALATLLRFHYSDPQDEQSVFLGMWRDGDREQIRKVGFSLLEMKRYLANRGIQSDGYRVTLEQIEQAQAPGIALINIDRYKHFVVVKGIDRLDVLVGDPSLGIRRLSRAEFLKMWNGVYFALNRPPPAGMRAFDMLADEDLAPRPIVPIDARPVELQVLALTRPARALGQL